MARKRKAPPSKDTTSGENVQPAQAKRSRSMRTRGGSTRITLNMRKLNRSTNSGTGPEDQQNEEKAEGCKMTNQDFFVKNPTLAPGNGNDGNAQNRLSRQDVDQLFKVFDVRGKAFVFLIQDAQSQTRLPPKNATILKLSKCHCSYYHCYVLPSLRFSRIAQPHSRRQ